MKTKICLSSLFLTPPLPFIVQYVCVLGAGRGRGVCVGSKERKWRKALKNASYHLKKYLQTLFILMVSGFTKCWVG